MKFNFTKVITLALFCTSMAAKGFSQTIPTLEMDADELPLTATFGSSLQPMTSILKNDVANGSSFLLNSPEINVTVSLRNQQFTSLNYGSTNAVPDGSGGFYSNLQTTGLLFGVGPLSAQDGNVTPTGGTPLNSYDFMAAYYVGGNSGPKDNMYTTNPKAVGAELGTGMNALPSGFDNTNGAFQIFTTAQALFGSANGIGSRVYFGDIVFRFNIPVKDPVLHFSGLGGAYRYCPPTGNPNNAANYFSTFFSTELELVNTGLTSTKLSGNPFFDVTGNNISNSNDVNPNGGSFDAGLEGGLFNNYGAATGSVKITGTVQEVVYRVYLQSGTASQFAWSVLGAAVINNNRQPFTGDIWYAAASLDKPTQQIIGSVFNDVDALTDNDINKTAGVSNVTVNPGASLFANLLNSSGLVVASVPVSADGVYLFDAVPAGSNYRVQLTTISSAGTFASPVAAPAAVLPPGWVSTGEFIGAGTGSDGTVNSISNTLAVASTDIKTEVNFGIQRLPESAITLQASQPNPGGFTFVPVSAGAFQTSNVGVNPNTLDYDGGTVNNIIITAFPSNTNAFTVGGVTYTNGGICPVGLTCTTWPGTLTVPYNNGIGPVPAISVDPIDGSVSPVINFVALDNAGRQDATPGSVTLPLNTITLAGIVWNDVDGNVLINNAEGVINGTNTGGDVLTGNVLYANLVNAAGIVIATTPIAANGTYLFNNIPTNTNSLIVQLSATQGAIGVAKQTATLPTPTPTNIWVTTGESSGGTIDGLANSEVLVNSLATNIMLINFGIEQRPNTTSSTMPNQTNNQSDFSIPVPLTQFGGSDPDAGGTVVQLRVVSFPTNVNSISIDNIKYGAGFTPWPAQGVTVNVDPSTGQPTVPFAVDPVDGVNSVVITYAQIDNAGKEDLTPGAVTIPFTLILPITGLEFTISNAANCTFILDWKTRTETNTKQFEIEYRTENGNWSTIFVVAAKGNSTNEQLYRIAHQLPAKGINYYRIKVVDKDGQFSYSTIKTVVSSCNGKQIITVYPNPVREALLVKGAQFGDMIQVMNMEGKLLLQSNANGSQTDKLNTSVLINGMYLVKILSSDGSIYVVKLTKF